MTEGVTVETSAVRRSLQNASNVLDGSVATLITIAVALLPFAVIGAVGLFVLRAWWRRRRARRAAPAA